jgi:hypothetical protein
MPIAALRWPGKVQAVIGGIDQCDDLLGAQAVELLIAQLNHNERGPPRQPGMMLFPGQWVAATSDAPSQRRAQPKGSAPRTSNVSKIAR